MMRASRIAGAKASARSPALGTRSPSRGRHSVRVVRDGDRRPVLGALALVLVAGRALEARGRVGLGLVQRLLLQQRVGQRLELVPVVADHRQRLLVALLEDRKSTRLNSSHLGISYAVFCLKKKKKDKKITLSNTAN